MNTDQRFLTQLAYRENVCLCRRSRMFPTVIRGLAPERTGKSVVMFVGAYHLRNGATIRVLEPCREICIYNKVFRWLKQVYKVFLEIDIETFFFTENRFVIPIETYVTGSWLTISLRNPLYLKTEHCFTAH